MRYTKTSYMGKEIHTGDIIKSIETGWIGKVMEWENQNGFLMMKCMCFATGEIERDDIRWFAPEDTRHIH